MVETKRAVGIPISLYPKQIEAVKIYASAKKYSSDSRAYQEIIDDFFTRDNKQASKDFVLYLVVPSMFCFLTTIINVFTDKVFNNLLELGFYYNDLFILSRVFMILSAGSIGILIACVYLFRRKQVENREIMYYGDSD